MEPQLCSLNKIRLGPVQQPRFEADSLHIPFGVTAILGKSGAGKTSLLNLLVGFESADQGNVEFEDRGEQHQLELSWVPPDFGLWSHLSVREHLEAVAGGHAGGHIERVNDFINGFDLEECQHQVPATLSMGERARLAVARSLASGAAVHVMDEPFAHVDPARIDRYWSFVRNWLQKTKSSLIFASHSPTVVMREAQHVICLESGKIVWTGEPQELYHSPPSLSLGSLLGPLNWLEDSLGEETSQTKKQSARPEEITLTEFELQESKHATEELWSVEENWQLGVHQESLLKNLVSGDEKTVYHRSQSKSLPTGTKVALRFVTRCILLCVLMLNSGCRESAGNEPVIRLEQFNQYLLPAEGAMLPAARGMTYSPTGELLILDNVGRLLKYDATGQLIHKWWMPDYDVGRPEGVCVMHDGRIAVADTHYNRVVVFDKNYRVSTMFGEAGHDPGQFIYSSAIVQDDDGFLYVAEYGGNDRIQKFTKDGEFVLQFGAVGAEDGEFQRPSGLVWHEGVLYVADAINNRIQAFTAEGKFLRIVADAHSTGLYYPYDISLGPEHTLFVIEYGAGRMTRIDLDGKLLGRFGVEGRGTDQFWTPWGIAVNQSGKIAVADTGNRRVVELQLE